MIATYEASLKVHARKASVSIRKNRFNHRFNQIPFFGHIISDKGLIADASKIEAILKMEDPNSCPKTERFLGMVNYLSKVAPHLAEITSPFRSLLKKDAYSKVFEKAKQTITQSPVLGFFDPDKELPWKWTHPRTALVHARRPTYCLRVKEFDGN